MSSAEKSTPASETAVTPESNPMLGGRWRQVKLEELTSDPIGPVAESQVCPNDEARPTDVEPASGETAGEIAGGKREETEAPPVEGKQKLATESKSGVQSGAQSGAKPRPKLRLERRQELEHHLKESPTDLEAFMELGAIYRADNRPLDAKRIYQQALQIFPDEKELLWEYEEAVLARSLQQLREVTDLAKRLDTLEAERELKRSQSDWACRRMEVCQARLARDPSLEYLRIALAEAMYDAGLFEGAVEELEPILSNDELSPSAYLTCGRAQLAMSQDVEAMASLRATALRRSVVAPLRTRVTALKLLCETAERLGVTLTLANYRQHLHQAEQELAKQMPTGN